MTPLLFEVLLLQYRYCTLLPAEPGLSEDPELVIVKVDLSSWWQEGVCQLAIQSIKAWVEWRPPAVRVVKSVET